MAYLIGAIIALMIIGAITSKNEAAKGAKWLKNEFSPGVTPTSAQDQEHVILLIEQLTIEGYLYGPSVVDDSNCPIPVSNPELSTRIGKLLENGSLEKVLPRLGIAIRSTANCSDVAFARQYPRMLVTPRGHAIGYRA